MFLVAQRPSFWIEFGTRLGKALLPLARRYVSMRVSRRRRLRGVRPSGGGRGMSG